MTKTTEPVLEPCQTCQALDPNMEAVTAKLAAQAGGKFQCRECGRTWNTHPAPSPDVAALVERLLEYCRCDPEQTCLFCDTIPTTLATLSAENERLRGALTAVYNEGDFASVRIATLALGATYD